jgi:hypothetical protein
MVAATLRPWLARAIDREPPTAATLSRIPVRPKPADCVNADRISAAITFNADQKRIFVPTASLDPEQDLARCAVSQRVGQAFLHDAVGCGGDSVASCRRRLTKIDRITCPRRRIIELGRKGSRPDQSR